MKGQIENIVKVLATLVAPATVEEVTSILEKLENDRHVKKAISDEIMTMYGRRLLQRLGYPETDKIFKSSARLGKMIEIAYEDRARYANRPDLEDTAYLRSNTTYGNQCGHRSDDPIWCSVCGRSTKPFTGPTVADMLYADEY